MNNLSVTALGGDDGAVIRKVTVTYYVTYYGSSGPAYSGLTDTFLIANVVQNSSSLKNKTKNKQNQIATQRICSDVRAHLVWMDKVM